MHWNPLNSLFRLGNAGRVSGEGGEGVRGRGAVWAVGLGMHTCKCRACKG